MSIDKKVRISSRPHDVVSLASNDSTHTTSSSSIRTVSSSTLSSDDFDVFEDLESDEFDLYIETLRVFQEYFAEYTDDDFVLTVNKILQDYRHLQIENMIFQMSLEDNEPGMLSNMPLVMKKIAELQNTNPLIPSYFDLIEDVHEKQEVYEMDPFAKGPRINVSHRVDLIARYMDEMRTQAEIRKEKTCRLREHYKSEIEESAIRIVEAKDALTAFETNVVVEGTDPLTQRVPAEKFILYMHDWMRNARRVTEKIRLNISFMKGTYRKLKALYEAKVELGVQICEIDFDGYRIDNQRLRDEIEQKNANLVELKRISGAASLELATYKRSLLNLDICYKNMQKYVEEMQEARSHFENEIASTAKQLIAAKENYVEVKYITEHCKAPDANKYLRVKNRQYELEKKHKVLLREENINAITRRTYELILMKMTHQKTIDPVWYLPVPEDEEFFVMRQSGPEEVASEFDIFKALKVKRIMRSISEYNVGFDASSHIIP